MAALHGRRANVTGIAPTLVTGFSLNFSTQSYETTALAATPPTVKTHAADGLIKVEGAMACQLDATDNPLGVNDTATATFWGIAASDPDYTTGESKWVGGIVITNVDVKTDRKDVQTVDYTFMGQGTFTQTWTGAA